MVSPLIRQGLGSILGGLEAFDEFGAVLAAGDFNNDGRDDLAVGVPREDIFFNGSNQLDAGAVNVVYGSPSGPSGVNDQFWTQASFGIADNPEGRTGEFAEEDSFGHSVATGDFDGDGFADLAIGIPGEDINNLGRSGAVTTLYGSANGLNATGSQFWHQNQPGVLGVARFSDKYGKSLAVGDYNGDGLDDLAVGVPGEPLLVGGINRFSAGSVSVLYGARDIGLSADGDQLWNQSQLQGVSETNDRFGESLAAGDFNGDGRDDLVVGTPLEEFSRQRQDVGAINVIYGGNTRLSAVNNQLWHQNSPGILGSSAAGDQFGSVLGIGDFNGDGRDDLAVGVPLDEVNGVRDVGAVNVLYGSSTGLRAAGNQFWHQGSLGKVPQIADLFGSSLAVGDFNNDGRDDLAIGTPGDKINGIGAGSVHVIYGTTRGLSVVGNQVFHQNIPGVAGLNELGDGFGASLGTGDYNGDGFADLAVGVPGENVRIPSNINGFNDAGGVNIIFGSRSGLLA